MSYAIECKHLVKLLRLSITINFTKDEDNISQLGDYDAPFCEQQQYTHRSCCCRRQLVFVALSDFADVLLTFCETAVSFVRYSVNNLLA